MNRKKTNRILSLLLVTILIIGIVPTKSFATQNRYYNFSKNYAGSSDPGQYIANIAYAQLGKTRSDLGYSEAWCADFVSDCAVLAGQSAAIPTYGGVEGLYSRICGAGGYEVSSPKVGDIVFADWNYKKTFAHVEIIYSVSGSSFTTVSGNSGGGAGKVVTHSMSTSHKAVKCIVRPNYSGAIPSEPYNQWDFNKPATYPSYPGLLKNGSSGDTVRFIQTCLNWLGYNCGEADGIFGSNTANAVRSFQSDNGLEVDGIVGEQTWKSLINWVGPTEFSSDFYAYIINDDGSGNIWKHIESTGSNVQIAAGGNDSYNPKQIWHIKRGSDGRCTITNEYDGKMLDLNNFGTANGNNIQVYDANNSDAQKWVLFWSSNYTWGIRSACGMCVVDVNGGGNPAPGTNIQAWEFNRTSAQRFKMYDVTGYSKPGAPTESTLSINTLGTSETATVFSWTKSPLKNNWDYRTYDLKIGRGSGDSVKWDESLTKRDLTSTTYSMNLPVGTYTAQVVSVNEKYSGLLTYGNKVTFTVSQAHSYTVLQNDATYHWYKCETCSEITGKAAHSGGNATCAKKAVCSTCGKEYGSYNSSNHTGGKTVKNAKPATCASEGYTGDTYCLGCNTKLSSGETIKKLSHTYNTGTITKSATCISTGIKTYTCTSCGNTKDETISKTEHKYGENKYDTAHPHAIYNECSYCGNKKYTGSYQNVKTCEICNPPATLSQISINTLPSKTVYTVGEALNTTGLTLSAKYSDNTVKTVSSGFTTSGFSSASAGQKTVTVSYQGKTTTFSVTVKEKTSEGTLVIGQVHGKAGDTVEVLFTVKDAPALKSFSITNLNYDKNKLTLEKVTCKLDDVAIQQILPNGDAVIALNKNQTVNKVIFTYSFKIKTNTESCTLPISCSFSAKTKSDGEAEKTVEFTVTPGNVIVEKGLVGDVNGDGVVDSDDAIYLLWYTYLPEDYPVSQNCDFNGDGVVDSDDSIYLLWYTYLPGDYPLN